MPHRETLYENHDEDTGTSIYGSRIYNDNGSYATRYDRYSNLSDYDNCKDNHAH